MSTCTHPKRWIAANYGRKSCTLQVAIKNSHQQSSSEPTRFRRREVGRTSLDDLGIDPSTSRMLSERSTI